LDAATEQKLMSSLKGAPYASSSEFLQEYESEESISVELVEWLKDEWAIFQKENPKKSAKHFAKSKLADFMSGIE
jgi:hypothetical protein